MLKGDEGALIAAAVAGRSLEEVAEAAQVSISTAQRRLRDHDIAAAIHHGRADRQRQAVGRLNSGLNHAIDRLRELIGDEDPGVALRAIDKFIAHAYRFNKDMDLAGTGISDADEDGAK